MGKYERVPPGGGRAAGWFPDPAHQGHARYWDGHSWTERVAAAPQVAASSQAGGTPWSVAHPVHDSGDRSPFGPVFYVGMVLAALGLVFGFFVYVGQQASDPGAEDADGACRQYVAARLQAPSSAEFSDVEAIAPVTGDQWTVTGTVESRTTTGWQHRADYACTVASEGAGWRLVSLRFPTG